MRGGQRFYGPGREAQRLSFGRHHEHQRGKDVFLVEPMIRIKSEHGLFRVSERAVCRRPLSLQR